MTRNLLSTMGLLACLLLFTTCTPDETVDDKVYPEFIVFGWYQLNQDCNFAQCTNLFKLEPARIAKHQENGNLPQFDGPFAGNYVLPISDTRYQAVEDVFRDQIPAEFLEMPSGVIGIPNASFYWYFEYKDKDRYRHYSIDNSFGTNIPASVQQMITMINQATQIANTP